MKIYNRAGRPNFKEKKLIDDLRKHFEANPDIKFTPANNQQQLVELHSQFCIEDVSFVETKKDGTTETHTPEAEPEKEETHKSFRDSIEVEPELFPQDDPMNRHEPIIRDYVKDDGFDRNADSKEQQATSNFAEPTNFRDSFSLPDDTIEDDKKGTAQKPLNDQPRPKSSSQPADPDAKVKKKSRKKFTKYAVDAACALAGKGIVWWSTKDITKEALHAAVMGDEISERGLEMIVYLDAATTGTVRQFFQQSIIASQDLANFTADEKEDLCEALEDFMEYKKIEINPTINLIVIGLGMMFDRALKAMQIKAENASILQQLKNMHVAGSDQSDADPAAEVHETEPEQEQNPETKHDQAIATIE